VERCPDMAWTDHNVKVRELIPFRHNIILNMLQILYQNAIHFAEVKFFFIEMLGDELHAFALVSLYALPNEHVLQYTNNSLVVCRYHGEGALVVIDVRSILSVVAMIPFPFLLDGYNNQYFMVEKIGLDVIEADILEDDE